MNAAQLQQGVDALACYNTAISIIQREGPACTDAESAAELRRTMATAYASVAVSSNGKVVAFPVVSFILTRCGRSFT